MIQAKDCALTVNNICLSLPVVNQLLFFARKLLWEPLSISLLLHEKAELENWRMRRKVILSESNAVLRLSPLPTACMISICRKHSHHHWEM